MPHPHIAMVADPATKQIHGMWLSPQYEGYAQNQTRLAMMIVAESMPVEIFAHIDSGSYRIVPNTINDRGGVYVMFGTAKAPGEGTATSRKTPPSRIVTVPPREVGSGSSATDWFKDASERGGPNVPSDFNLFELPRYSLQEWARQVSSNPRGVQCTVLLIADVGSVTQALFDVIKHDHNLPSSEAVKVFDEYLGAACPKCFGGLRGSLLQTISASSKTAGVVFGGAQLQRILSGRCATCESDTYYIVWHGDKAVARVSAPVREHSFEVKKELIPRLATPTRRCPNCDAVLYGALVSRCYKCHAELAEDKTGKSATAVSVQFWKARDKGDAPSSKETILETKRWWQFWK